MPYCFNEIIGKIPCEFSGLKLSLGSTNCPVKFGDDFIQAYIYSNITWVWTLTVEVSVLFWEFCSFFWAGIVYLASSAIFFSLALLKAYWKLPLFYK